MSEPSPATPPRDLDRLGYSPAFAIEEYQARLRSVAALIAERGLDAMLVVDPCNMNWLTGYDAISYYVPQSVLVLADGTAHWLGRGIDIPCARYTTHLAEDRMAGYPDSFLVLEELHPMEWIAGEVRARAGRIRRLGIELDGYTFTPRGYVALTSVLSDVELVDVGHLVNRARIVKSPAEIEYVRQAGTIAQRTMAMASEFIALGVRQSDLVGEINRSQARGTDEFGGEAVPPCLNVGVQSDAPHLAGTDVPFRPGDMVNLELGGCRRRYHAGISRTFSLGKPEARLAELAAVTSEGYDAVTRTLRAGATCEEVAGAWSRTIAKHGIEKSSRIGYSIGVGNVVTTWIEHSASLAEGDRTVLQPDMTFHVMLGMWLPDGGYVFSETLRVTDGDPEVLCTAPAGVNVVER